MSRLRADLWCAAFLRRHNDLGNMCVIARKGDPTAGQIWLSVDHLNGEFSLYTPAPATVDDTGERRFECRFERVERQRVEERIQRESEFDPDFWVVELNTRSNDIGIL